MLDSALSYARAGYSVFPLRGKIPRTAHGSRDATTDETTIRAWWAHWPNADIGMTLGGLVVVDVDPRNGGDARHLPVLPGACVAKTGGGGLHYVFRAVQGARYPGKYCAGVDLKSGAGSYIVVAPSLHASGNRYEWIGPSPAETAPAMAPGWLALIAASSIPTVRPAVSNICYAPNNQPTWTPDKWVKDTPTSQSKVYRFRLPL